MATGNAILDAIHSEATCGEACWRAQEDICRCSCGGRNHACLRHEEKRPERTRRLGGYTYQLVAVAVPGSCVAVEERPLYDLKTRLLQQFEQGGWKYMFREGDPGYPVKLKVANESEVSRWPELAIWRGRRHTPLTAWARVDLLTSGAS